MQTTRRRIPCTSLIHEPANGALWRQQGCVGMGPQLLHCVARSMCAVAVIAIIIICLLLSATLRRQRRGRQRLQCQWLVSRQLQLHLWGKCTFAQVSTETKGISPPWNGSVHFGAPGKAGRLCQRGGFAVPLPVAYQTSFMFAAERILLRMFINRYIASIPDAVVGRLWQVCRSSVSAMLALLVGATSMSLEVKTTRGLI